MHPVHEAVLAYMADPGRGEFATLALAVFQHQFETVAPYRRYCERRGRTPARVRRWEDIPPVPVGAFKLVEFACGPPRRVFLSSGTTRGPEHRSRHPLPDLRLYHRAALLGLERFVFPDREQMRLVSLIPSPEVLPHSSLAQMVGWAMERFGAPGSAYAADERGVDLERFVGLLEESERSGEWVAVLTTTGALIGVVEMLRAAERRFRLPHGSRLMDTGGLKGAPRPLSPNGVRRAVWETFAIPGYYCINEYGMTELSSQFYDNVLANRLAGRHEPRYKRGPHWVRTRILDPETLEPVEPGTMGLLCHYDLANAGTVLAVLTEDMGRAVGEGFELLGRAPGAEPRGCSLTAAEWQAAGRP